MTWPRHSVKQPGFYPCSNLQSSAEEQIRESSFRYFGCAPGGRRGAGGGPGGRLSPTRATGSAEGSGVEREGEAEARTGG